jgi:hypothetical protein
VRGRVSATQCPKSIINEESNRFLEMFATWKLQPAADLHRWPARDVDALLLLENEWRSLDKHGESA